MSSFIRVSPFVPLLVLIGLLPPPLLWLGLRRRVIVKIGMGDSTKEPRNGRNKERLVMGLLLSPS